MHHHQCLINLPVNMGPPFSNGMGITNQLIYSDPFTITMSGQLLLLYDPFGGVCCVNYLRLHDQSGESRLLFKSLRVWEELSNFFLSSFLTYSSSLSDAGEYGLA